MTRFFLSLILAAIPFSMVAETLSEGPWYNYYINGINRLPAHSTSYSYQTSEQALSFDRNASRINFLNGTWKFFWQQGVDDVRTDYYAENFDDSSWDDMPVPSLWQFSGYGKPIYLCNSLPSALSTTKNDIPKINHDLNEIGVYRRTFDIPESFDGKEIFIHFGAVKAGFSFISTADRSVILRAR